MGTPESSIHIPEPKDEFRKTRLGLLSDGMNQDIGFTNFRLAQKLDTDGKKLGRASYGVNLQNKTGNEKQDELLIYLTQYLSDIELGPVEIGKDGRFIFDKDSNPDKRNKIYEKIINPCIVFLGKIEDRFKEFKDIQYFSIDKGIFSLGIIIPPRKDIQVININLSSMFTKNTHGEFVFNEQEMGQELQGRVRQSIDSLRASLETESFFDGGLIVSYETKERTKKIIGTTLQVVGAIGSISTLEYGVRRMMFRDEAGRMQEVDPKIIRSIVGTIGDKTRINQLLLKIMQKTGRVFNSVRGAFTDVNTLGIDRATKKIKNLKKTDITETSNMTDAEFEQAKGEIAQKIARTPRSVIVQKAGDFLKNSNTFAKGILGKGVHYMFWGVFFAEYQKNTYDIANMYKGIADTGLFLTGANLGSRVALGVWKMPVGLIGGGLAVLGGHMAGGAMGLDKKIWRMMPERVVGNGEKSVTGHIIFGGATNDVTDKMNTDLGIPGTRGGAVIYNPLGKDGIMPNVDFARTNIDFGVNPREYLTSRIGGTDTHWNKRMDEYVRWSTDAIMKVLLDFNENRGYFSSSNWNENQEKNQLLKERLKHILDSDDGKNKRNTLIIEDCIEYISYKITKIKNPVEQKELLSIFLGNYGNVLKIDEDSLKYDETLLERDRVILDGQTQMYLSLLSPEKRAFAEKMFTRLQKGEILVDGKLVKHQGDMIGQDVTTFRADKKELSLYQSLFNDIIPIKNEWYDILGYNNTIEYKNKSFSLPDKVVKIGGKNVYLRSYFELMIREYLPSLKSGNTSILAQTDTKYGIKTIDKAINNGKVVSDIEFRSILLESICSTYPDVSTTIAPPPNQSDILIYLLNTRTEYREQKRFIETQKSIGYANKWKL